MVWRVNSPLFRLPTHSLLTIVDSSISSDTGYRAVPDLPKEIDDYGPEHQYPHCPVFKQIGDLRGPFDLGLIPIGAYDPRW